MSFLAVAVAAQLLANADGETKPDSSWRAVQERSLVSVTSNMPRKENPKAVELASGFVVGWKKPYLFVVTAAHAVEDREGGITSKGVEVRLAPTLCPEATVTKWEVVNRKLELDAAVLTVQIPDWCAQNANDLRHAPMSSIALTGVVPDGTDLQVLGRYTSGGMASWKVGHIKPGGGDIITAQTDVVQQEMSGGPVFTDAGDLVAITRARLNATSTVAYLTSYGGIRNQLKIMDVPGQFAGDFAVLDLDGYPPGSTLSIDGAPPQLVARVNLLVPGKRSIEISNSDGYQPASATLILDAEKHAKQCVSLTRRADRIFARMWKPVLWVAIPLIVGGGIVGAYALHENGQFDDMPSSTLRKDVHSANLVADWSMTIGGAVALSVVAASLILTPRDASSIHECGR